MSVRRLQILFSVALSAVVAFLIYLNWHSILESLKLTAKAHLGWVAAAFILELIGFFVASQVYRIGLRSLHYKGFHALRLWATAMIAIVMSQSFPAGGVASYAFLVHSFRRRGVTASHSALLATLEALSYTSAMILLFGFSLVIIGTRGTFGRAETDSLIAAAVGVVVICLIVFILTREEALLRRWALAVKRLLEQLARRRWDDDTVLRGINELVRGRDLITARWLDMLMLIVIQLIALTIHSLALMAVLFSLGATVSLPIVMAAFGIALVSSTFNVLPGGGGTVEAAIVVTLTSLGVGPEAIPATIIFRLLNYWFMVPIALISYRIMVHGAPIPPADSSAEAVDNSTVADVINAR